MAWPLPLSRSAESAHGGRSMTLSLIAPVIVFGGLAQITPSGGQWTTWELLGLVVVGLILFVALTGLLVLLARQAPPQDRQLLRSRLSTRPVTPHACAWAPRSARPPPTRTCSRNRSRRFSVRFHSAPARPVAGLLGIVRPARGHGAIGRRSWIFPPPTHISSGAYLVVQVRSAPRGATASNRWRSSPSPSGSQPRDWEAAEVEAVPPASSRRSRARASCSRRS